MCGCKASEVREIKMEEEYSVCACVPFDICSLTLINNMYTGPCVPPFLSICVHAYVVWVCLCHCIQEGCTDVDSLPTFARE